VLVGTEAPTGARARANVSQHRFWLWLERVRAGDQTSRAYATAAGVSVLALIYLWPSFITDVASFVFWRVLWDFCGSPFRFAKFLVVSIWSGLLTGTWRIFISRCYLWLSVMLTTTFTMIYPASVLEVWQRSARTFRPRPDGARRPRRRHGRVRRTRIEADDDEQAAAAVDQAAAAVEVSLRQDILRRVLFVLRREDFPNNRRDGYIWGAFFICSVLQLIYFFEKCNCMAMSTLAAPAAAAAISADAISTVAAEAATIAEQDVVTAGMEAQNQTAAEADADAAASPWQPLDPAGSVVVWFELVCLLVTRGWAFQLHYGIDRMPGVQYRDYSLNDPLEALIGSLSSYDFSRSASALAWYALALGRYALVYWSDASFPLLSPTVDSGGGAAHRHHGQHCTDCPGGSAGFDGAEHDGHGAAAPLVLRPYQAIITWLVGYSTILALWPLARRFLRHRHPHWQGVDGSDDPLSGVAVAGGVGLMFGLVAMGLLSSVGQEEPVLASSVP
jgi:hypothetical protein